MAGFRSLVQKATKNGLAAFSKEELLAQMQEIDTKANPFPLDVFPSEIKPYITALVEKYDLPDAFVGTSLISAYSTAIGTSYTVSTNTEDSIYLPVWACLLGMSSSGKSLTYNKVFKPLQDIQNELSKKREEEINGLSDNMKAITPLKATIYRDSHIATLTRTVLKDNPKGICKTSDELLEWINGMNQLSKGKDGTDEQFWLSTWNCAPYSAIRSQRDSIVLPRPFVNVIGGTQYSLLGKLFGSERGTTGFIYRILFAKPTIDKVPDIDTDFVMPLEYYNIHDSMLRAMFFHLPVDDCYEDPKRCVLSPSARVIYNKWKKDKHNLINNTDDFAKKELIAGIFGKIQEYSLRFAAILSIAEQACLFRSVLTDSSDIFTRNKCFPVVISISSDMMNKGIKLAEYFMESAQQVTKLVNHKIYAPYEVMVAAHLIRSGRSFMDIAYALTGEKSEVKRKQMERQVKKWIIEYPKVFGAYAN